MFVVISRFAIANDMQSSVRQAFRERPHLVGQVAGFIRLEVLSPIDKPEEIWLKTYWQDQASFTAWHRSEAYHMAHRDIPKRLKLDPARTQILHFEVIAE